MILIHINKAIYIGNYLEGGLTNKCRKHNIALSVGCMHRAEVFMEPDLKIRYRIKGNHSAKYFMPVYVLHTIVAAGIRTVLLKIGISSGVLHFMIGFCVSVFVPVVIYMIAEKQWWLLFWFEPIKAMKLKNQKKIKGGR